MDSSALFFLLLQAKIDFDIALVNYQTRESSAKEAQHALTLAEKYRKKCYIKEVRLPEKNFEHEARRVRYTFFEEIIRRHRYDTLLTAHHLNDRLEWFLMQLTKGAGLVEILGFSEVEAREHYTLLRPLIHAPKAALLAYLHEQNLPYFLDESNRTLKYRRNYFRRHFSDPLIADYAEGIERSFRYLEEDRKRLFKRETVTKIEALTILKSSGDPLQDLRQIDSICKEMGYLLSRAQRAEIAAKRDLVIADTIAIVVEKEQIFIAPYVREVMPKPFKEACRKAKIPEKIRPYLYSIGCDPASLAATLSL